MGTWKRPETHVVKKSRTPDFHVNVKFATSAPDRHSQLDADIRKHGFIGLIKRLNALRRLLKHKDPIGTASVVSDLDYVYQKFAKWKHKHATKSNTSKPTRRRSGKQRHRRRRRL